MDKINGMLDFVMLSTVMQFQLYHIGWGDGALGHIVPTSLRAAANIGLRKQSAVMALDLTKWCDSVPLPQIKI